MSILKRFSTNISDAIAFGPQFLRRHLPKITGAELAEIKVSKNQRMFVRAGESDSAAIRQTFKDRQYRIDFSAQCLARIQRRYESILANGATPIIVDAGANIGAASIWFSIHFPKATIIGIEPEPGNFSVFQKNADLVPNVKAVRAAIGAQAGFVKVVNDGLGWAARTERSCDGTRIMTMAEAFGMGVPFIAKIDSKATYSQPIRSGSRTPSSYSLSRTTGCCLANARAGRFRRQWAKRTMRSISLERS